MALATVGQLQALDRILGDLLRELEPRRVAVPGCTTGTGFAHLDPARTELVVAVDLNPAYLRRLADRFRPRLSGLLPVQGDLRRFSLRPARFDLVYCALVLEYLDPAPVVAEMARWLAPDGVLAVVLQLPSRLSGPVSRTPYRSLTRLEPVLRLVPPPVVERAAAAAGLQPLRSEVIPLPAGKAFALVRYRRPGNADGGSEG